MIGLGSDKKRDVDDSRITYKGALPGKYRPLIVGSDVQAEKGEDQDGGGPAQPCQGGRGGRGDLRIRYSLDIGS